VYTGRVLREAREAVSCFDSYTLVNGSRALMSPRQSYTFWSDFTQVLETPRIRLGGRLDPKSSRGGTLRRAARPGDVVQAAAHLVNLPHRFGVGRDKANS